MERGQVIVIAVVVAALALFGLKVWSDRTADSDLDGTTQAAAQRLARSGGVRGDSRDGSDSFSEGGAPGHSGSSMRPGVPGGAAGARNGVGPDGRGGAADTVRGPGGKVGSGLGFSGSSRGAGGSGSGVGVAGGGDSGAAHVGPSVQQRQNLVEFLSSQPATDPELASPHPDGEDVALKVEKTDDIGKQGGQDQNVQESDNGDGIKISDRGKIEFPNYANGDAGTISFKIQPEWAGADQTDNALLEIRGEHEWSNRMELVKNGEFLRFILTDNTGREADISVRITDWQAGNTYNVKASWGDGKTSLFLDDRLAGTNQYTGSVQFPEHTPMYVGGDHPGSNYAGANATLRDFTILNSADHAQ